MSKKDNRMAKKQILTVNKRRFQLLKKLGEGGTGSVWFAKNLESSRGSSYALKIMYLDVNDMTTQSARREIENMQQLGHPSIIKLLDAERKSEVNGHPAAVLVMECAPRGDLFEYIRINRGLRKKTDSSAVHRIFVDMVSALEHMHSIGICHRDIKPENILFDYNYTPRLADMGFSKVFRQNNQRIKLHEQLGSRGYHAPEIVREKYYSENVDVFSLGVVLFIMYAGSPPFRQVKKSDWWYEKLATKQYEKFWSAHERGMKFSSALKRLLEGMLAVNPRNRLTLKQVKESVWFKKKVRMDDQMYRSYMHSIYKKIHPRCKSGTPPPKVVKKEPVEERKLIIAKNTGGGDTDKAKTPEVKVVEVEVVKQPVIKQVESESTEPSEVESGDSIQDTVENQPEIQKSNSEKILNDITGPVKVQVIVEPEEEEEEEVEAQSDNESDTESEAILYPTENQSSVEIRKLASIRQALNSVLEDVRTGDYSPSRTSIPRHNMLDQSDDEDYASDPESIHPKTPLAKTPILGFEDIQHPLAYAGEDSSSIDEEEEEDSEIARAVRLATATYTKRNDKLIELRANDQVAKGKERSEPPTREKRKSWWNIFSF